MMIRPTTALFGILATVFWIGSAPVWALDENRVVDKAMRALKKGDRDAAAQTLEQALTSQPDSPFLNYHAGLASYQAGDYNKAKDYFARALGLKDKKGEADANYNAGNSLFQNAKKIRDTKPEQALELLKEALNYYGRALELNNKDKDASYNYELTDKVIQVIKKQIPPPMSQKQNQGGSKEQEKEQDKQKQQQQEQQQQEQKDQEKQKQEEQQKQQEQQQQQQQESQQQDQQQKEQSGNKPEEEAEKKPKQSGAEATHKEDLSKEEALMLVATYGQEGPRKDINKEKNIQQPAVLKNW